MVINVQVKKYENAIKAYNKAIDLQPNDYMNHALKAGISLDRFKNLTETLPLVGLKMLFQK